jgi:hypothetical protein
MKGMRLSLALTGRLALWGTLTQGGAAPKFFWRLPWAMIPSLAGRLFDSVITLRFIPAFVLNVNML